MYTKKKYFTLNKGNQDVRVSEKSDIKMLTYHPKLYKLGLVDNRQQQPSSSHFVRTHNLSDPRCNI